MKRWIVRWILLALSVIIASVITNAIGLQFNATYGSAPAIGKLFVGVAVLSLLNATLGKVIHLLTLPLSCLTLGAFSLVVNAIVLYIAASLDLGFSVGPGVMGFVAAFVASILISFINGMLGVFLPDGRDDDAR